MKIGHQAKRRNRSPRRHFQNGQRAAVVRATAAARLYATGQAPTLTRAPP